MLTTQKLALFGANIANSLSLQIHQLFARDAMLRIEYQLVETSTANFASKWTHFLEVGGMGANITAPLKQEALRCVDVMTARAEQAKAINTIFRKEDIWFGDNTDGLGFLNDLHRLNISLANKRILILGAGGAVKGIFEAIMSLDPMEIVIANRTRQHAENLLAQSECKMATLILLTDLAKENAFDFILHATSDVTEIEKYLNSNLIYQNTLGYDLNYGQKAKPFLDFAQANQMQANDGLGMLIYQAAESFYLWFGIRPQLNNVLDVLLPTLNSASHYNQ